MNVLFYVDIKVEKIILIKINYMINDMVCRVFNILLDYIFFRC